MLGSGGKPDAVMATAWIPSFYIIRDDRNHVAGFFFDAAAVFLRILTWR
jgi:hypothetical protein